MVSSEITSNTPLRQISLQQPCFKRYEHIDVTDLYLIDSNTHHKVCDVLKAILIMKNILQENLRMRPYQSNIQWNSLEL